LSSLTRQCVSGRRFESIGKLQSEIRHWSDHSNKRQRGVDWQFKVKDARKKLKSLYPKLKLDKALDLKQANAGGVRHGCFIEISDDTISSQR